MRLFRLLARKHANGGCSASGQFKFETKQLAAMALLPESRTRPVLMHLFKAGYAQLQVDLLRRPLQTTSSDSPPPPLEILPSHTHAHHLCSTYFFLYLSYTLQVT